MNAPVVTNESCQITPTSGEILAALMRGSALPLAFICPGSIRQRGILINASNEQARLGSAGHFLLKDLPKNGTIDWDSIDAIADDFGCDAESLRYACRQAIKLWEKPVADGRKVKDSFPGALTEVGVEHVLVDGLTLLCHLDGVSIFGDIANAWDWKLGRLDTDYYHQMMAYASAILKSFEHIREVRITILWARTQEAETYVVDREAADAWVRRLEAEVVAWDGVYHPNEKCIHCGRFYECEAANASTRATIASVMDLSIEHIESQLATMDPDQLIDLRHKLKVVGHVHNAASEALLAYMRHKGEVVGSTTMLKLDAEPRREADLQKTWDVAEEYGITWDEFKSTARTSLTRLEKIVGQKAGYGNGAKAIREFKEKLERCGAVEKYDIYKINERRL